MDVVNPVEVVVGSECDSEDYSFFDSSKCVSASVHYPESAPDPNVGRRERVAGYGSWRNCTW